MLKVNNYIKLISVISLAFLLTGCASGSLPSFDQLIINIGNNITPFWYLVTGAGYFFGFVFIMRGIFALKTYGEMRTMMSGQANLKGALVYLLVGSVLIFSPTIYETLLLSTFNATSTSPLQYPANTTLSVDAYNALLSFVSLIGIISFIRGWIMLTHLSNPSQQNSLGKALTHIIGGLFAINVQGTIDVVQGTLGMS